MRLVLLVLIAILNLNLATAYSDVAYSVANSTASPTAVANMPTIASTTSVASGGGASVCVVDNTRMKELDDLVKMLKIAEVNNQEDEAQELKAKIHKLKEDISEGTSSCRVAAQPVVAKRIEVVKTDECAELDRWQHKIDYYQKLYELSNEELKSKGYAHKEDIEKILSKLKVEKEKLAVRCRHDATAASAGGTGGVAAVTAPIEIAVPGIVTAETGNEITTHYKRRMTSIMESTRGTEDKISDLKVLREEIDSLIGELIKSRDSIKTDDIKDIVGEIRIEPKKIEAGSISIPTIGKRIVTKIRDREIEISPSADNVLINEGNLQVNTSRISIKDDVVKVGVMPLNVLPSQAVSRVSVLPKEIKLEEGKNVAVYKIKTEEKRRFIGIIPLVMKKETTIDATNSTADVIESRGAWWEFMTTKA